jgi:hypothetical protein
MLFTQISKSSNLQSKNEVFVREISLSEQCLDFASQAARWPTRAAAIRRGVGALYLAMSAKPRSGAPSLTKSPPRGGASAIARRAGCSCIRAGIASHLNGETGERPRTMSGRPIPYMTTDEEAEAFLDQDLSDLDFTQFRPLDGTRQNDRAQG